MTPQKKPIPSNLSLETQQKLLMQPETNPTGYEPFKDASDYKFNLDRSKTWRVNAWWLADAAWLAYWHDADAAMKMFRDRAGLSATFVDVKGAEAYFASCRDFAIVTFRGTQPDDWIDIFDDARYKAEPWEAGHVHEGFARRLQSLNNRLDGFIRGLPSNCPVWFTGHSLGAAVASLAAYRHRMVAGGVCTFGSPLVGNAVFSGMFDTELAARSLQYVHDHDVVTRVPPAPLAFPNGAFTHVDQVRWIDGDGHIATTMPSAAQFVRNVFGKPTAVLDVIELHQLHLAQTVTLRRAPTLPASLADHTPLYYALHCWNDFAQHFPEG